jgi:hypothetical protein
MPKELTHWILAERAQTGLNEGSRLRKLIRANYDCYLGGAVLPDTLLHLVRGPHGKAALGLAHQFHDTAGNSFDPLIRAEQRYPDGLPPAILACLLGVISHMLGDITFHPFVYALTGTDSIGRHYQLETDLDVHFLRTGTIPPVRQMRDLVSPLTRPILITTCALIFDPDNSLPRPALDQALDLHCRFQGMYDHTFWKLAVRLAARLTGAPFTEQHHLFYPLSSAHTDRFGAESIEWLHPVSGELRHTRLEQLAAEAVGRMVSLFERIESSGSLSATLESRPGENLLTGTHGVCLSTVK